MNTEGPPIWIVFSYATLQKMLIAILLQNQYIFFLYPIESSLHIMYLCLIFFFYFKAWKIDWEFVGTCFLDSLSHRKFFFIFRLSANCQGVRIWLWEVWMCSIQWIWSGIFLCCHALCQRCVSPSGHWKKEEN